MRKNRFFYILCLAMACLTQAIFSADKTPNIILYVADDFGRGCIEPYGADSKLVRTPHLSELSKQGITFDNAYVTASVCSPTRYTMLTGRYSWRTHLQFGVINPMDPLLIDVNTMTLPKWLKTKGYQTAQFGKWHLGYKAKEFENLLGEIKPGPNDVGFDYHFGVPNNMDDVHKVYIENDKIYGLRSDRISPYGKSFYEKKYFGYDAPQRIEPQIMEETTQRAIKWIDSRDKKKPFFLYYAAVAVHHPVMPSEKNLGSSKAGVYGDFIHDVDDSLGQFIHVLKENKILENTIVIFTSDNGSDYPEDLARPECQAVATGLDINTGLRGDKHTIYEGGLKVPMIISWPGSIKGGQRSEAFITTADFFATLSEVVSGKIVDSEEAAPDSVSFASVLQDPSKPSQRQYSVHRDVDGRKAVRMGKWKYIDSFVPRTPDNPVEVELYDIEKDSLEKSNVAKENPEIISLAKDILDKFKKAKSSRALVLGAN